MTRTLTILVVAMVAAVLAPGAPPSAGPMDQPGYAKAMTCSA